LVLPAGQLDRRTYEAVNTAIAAAGGKWNRKAGAHMFENDPRIALGLAVEAGTVVHRKNTLQAFYTPAALADQVVALADPRPGERALEPSCGDGALIAALLRREPALREIRGFDIDEGAIAIARGHAASLLIGDFLTIAPNPFYDVLVMNPPFSKDQDIDHVMHAWRFIRPGGRLVSIMSAGWSYPEPRLKKRRAFQSFVRSLDGRIVELGGDAFKESGANVHTVMIRLDKPAE
jgi:methylase of polypeptide subunit release factors